MTHVTIGDREYRISCTEAGGTWTARAFRADNGDPFGVESTAASAEEAARRLTAWLEWQDQHASALADLQSAERVYHRTIAGSAFASPTEGPTPLEMQKESLDAVERARLRLDDLRRRRPPV